MGLRQSHLSDSDSILQKRLAQDGYLFFRDFLDQHKVLQARWAGLRICLKLGLLCKTKNIDEAKINPRKRIKGTTLQRFDTAVTQEGITLWSDTKAYDRVYRDRRLQGLLRRVIGEPIARHPLREGRWGRFGFPSKIKNPTPGHQDVAYLKVPTEAYTVWIPAGDCPNKLGPLELWPRSHRQGLIPHDGQKGLSRKHLLRARWLSANFKIGDLVIFNSHLVHRARPNLTKVTLRLSLDFRYCRRNLISNSLLAYKKYGNL